MQEEQTHYEELEDGVRILRLKELEVGSLAKILDFIPETPINTAIYLNGEFDHFDLARLIGVKISREELANDKGLKFNGVLKFDLGKSSNELVLNAYKGYRNLQRRIMDPTSRRRYDQEHSKISQNLDWDFWINWYIHVNGQKVNQVRLGLFDFIADYQKGKKPGYITKIQNHFREIDKV